MFDVTDRSAPFAKVSIEGFITLLVVSQIFLLNVRVSGNGLTDFRIPKLIMCLIIIQLQ